MTSGPWAWTQASAFLKASKTLLLVAVVESRGSKTVVLSELGAGRGVVLMPPPRSGHI